MVEPVSSKYINILKLTSMEKKEFSKFFIASLKRTAQNVQPLVKRKVKLLNQLGEMREELCSLQAQIDGYQVPIKEVTGGWTTEDLVERVIVDTGKVGKDGKPIKMTQYVLKYPDTIVPPTEIHSESEAVVVDDNDNVVEDLPFVEASESPAEITIN